MMLTRTFRLEGSLLDPVREIGWNEQVRQEMADMIARYPAHNISVDYMRRPNMSMEEMDDDNRRLVAWACSMAKLYIDQDEGELTRDEFREHQIRLSMIAPDGTVVFDTRR